MFIPILQQKPLHRIFPTQEGSDLKTIGGSPFEKRFGPLG